MEQKLKKDLVNDITLNARSKVEAWLNDHYNWRIKCPHYFKPIVLCIYPAQQETTSKVLPGIAVCVAQGPAGQLLHQRQ